jgi:frataxin-like iron-binding protein CyaY
MNATPMIERYALFAFGNPVAPTDSFYCSFEKTPKLLAANGIYYRDFEGIPSRGNPLIYSTKISKAKQAASELTTTVDYDNHCFSFLSRNNDGVSRRRMQISTTAGKLNTAFMGGVGTGSGSVNEIFIMNKVAGNTYKLKVNNNCLTLSVRNDSVVVENETNNNNQLWEMVAITGTNYFALKNSASGKYLNPLNNNISIGTLLTLVSSTDITLNKAAHWEPIASGTCNCADASLGVFDIKVEPLIGSAPLTVNLLGAKQTTENKDAFYRWYMFQGADTLMSNFYQDQITYTQPGNYRIKVRGRDYVSRITTKEYSITVNTPSAVENVSISELSIFPNPIGEAFQLKGIAEGKKVSLYDAQGRLALQTNFTGKSIKTNQLLSGFYILKCEGFAPLKLMKK